ncbi:MAG: element excision factor XisH family protein [Nostoc sp. S4]|nr:element excision factor XisH family protein [Nostoc sp. S4]
MGQSDVKDLEQALGQYVLYRQILNEMGSDRILYLAVSRPTFNSVFTIELGQVLSRWVGKFIVEMGQEAAMLEAEGKRVLA